MNAPSTQQLRQGRRLLLSLLPAARAKLRKARVDDAYSPLAEAQFSHLTDERQLHALLIYEAPLGGWHADLLFDGMPDGYPNTLGTAKQAPARTRREAEDQAQALLVLALDVIAKNQAQAPQPQAPVFMLHGWGVPLSQSMFQVLAQVSDGQARYDSREEAVQRIEEVLAELLPDGFDDDGFKALDFEARTKLLSVLHLAAATGVFRYPPNADASPSGHGDVSLAAH